jgi:hypothetical protein
MKTIKDHFALNISVLSDLAQFEKKTHLHDRIISLRGQVLTHKTRLTHHVY